MSQGLVPPVIPGPEPGTVLIGDTVFTTGPGGGPVMSTGAGAGGVGAIPGARLPVDPRIRFAGPLASPTAQLRSVAAGLPLGIERRFPRFAQLGTPGGPFGGGRTSLEELLRWAALFR